MNLRAVFAPRALIALLVVSAAAPEIRYFRYEGLVVQTHSGAVAPQASGAGLKQTCVTLDAGVFEHAAPGLADLRLYRDTTETPYVVREAMPVEQQRPMLAPLNLGKRHGETTFEAAMPQGRYSDVNLNVTAKNFIATVAVTGSQTDGGREGTELGLFTIFDLSGQRLGRSTVLHLPQSDFRYLYFAIAGPVKSEDVAGLSVERVSEKQTYVTVADTNQVKQKVHATTVQFRVPSNVPVERVEFVVGAEPGNFSRDVTVTVAPAAKPTTDAEPLAPVESSGNLLRLHATRDGHRIDEEDLAVDAPWVEFGASGSLWTVSVDNGDDAPLAITDVRLEMAERKLCFDAAAGAAYTLYFGDAALVAPRYDYARMFVPEADAAQATLGPQKENPEYEARPDGRAFTERHPGLLWVALILVVVVLGVVALRSARETKA
jgi:hypothetical protein